jgi:hypothetical protein
MKTCSQCKTNKDEVEFFNDKGTWDGKSPACKDCIYKRRKQPKKANTTKGHKQCNGCKIIKPYNEFWADSANKTDGRYSHCKVCKNLNRKFIGIEQDEKYYQIAVGRCRRTE